MKHDWPKHKLGDVLTFIGGGTPSKDVPAYYEGAIPWASVRDMTQFQLNSTEFSITEEAVNASATNIIPKGSIVISTHVGLGKICVLMQDTAINQDLKGIKFNDDTINKFFFSYWYISIANHIIDNGRGATVKGVTLNFMKELSMPIPSTDIQSSVVAELDKINEAIAAKQEQLKQLDELVKSQFIELFGDPVTNEKGWPMVQLSEVAEIKIGPFGSLLHKEDYIEGGHALINPSHIVEGKIAPNNNLTISEDKFESLSAYKLEIDDIVLGRRGEMGRCAVVDKEGLLCGTGSMIIRPNGIIRPFFLQKILSSTSLKTVIERKSVGTTMMNINVPIVSSLSIPLLPKEEQDKYISLLHQADKLKFVIRQQISELQTLLASRMDYWFND